MTLDYFLYICGTEIFTDLESFYFSLSFIYAKFLNEAFLQAVLSNVIVCAFFLFSLKPQFNDILTKGTVTKANWWIHVKLHEV